MLILLYHGVRPASDTVSPDIRQKHVPEAMFRQQIAYLTKRFRPVRLSEVVACLKNGMPLPKAGICITFDDGYENNATAAAPILKQFGMPATFFVTTDFLDGKTRLWVDRFETAFSALPASGETDDAMRSKLKRMTPDERETVLRELEAKAGTLGTVHPLHRAMSWEQAKTMANDGFEIGAHTLTHPVLTALSHDEATNEIAGSRRRIEEHGIDCTYFALPNGQPGDWNPDVLAIIKGAGFDCNLTTVDGRIKNGDDSFTLKRTTIDTGNDFLKFRLTVSGLRSTIHGLRHALHL